MAKFYVGQRVRIIGATLSKFLIGTEATITALNVPANGTYGVYYGHATDAINAYGVAFVGKPHELEPITDPGREVLSWADERCVWRPSGVEA
ncbi:MAG: hypothetical protein ACTHOL_17945 [Luteibacter jiangsuensis]